MLKTGHYTGIGSRDTPVEVQRMMAWLAGQLRIKGYILRSGAADGADRAFEIGCFRQTHQRGESLALTQRIYLPSNRFNTKTLGVVWARPEEGFINAQLLPTWEQAAEIAKHTHPNWAAMEGREWIQWLHTRNVFQILGDFLNYPSEMVVYWAPESANGNIKGGTRTAVVLARQHQIPCYNLALPGHWEQLLERLELV